MTESLLVCGFIKAAKQLHLGLLRNILKSPMSFFDTTPVGRIVNRFSKDIDAIDNRLIYEFKDTIISLFCFIICMLTVCSATPLSGVVMVLLTLVYFYFQVNYFKLCQIDIFQQFINYCKNKIGKNIANSDMLFCLTMLFC